MSSMNILFIEEFDDFLVYIETQNFTRIHIKKSTCSTKELSINMTKSLSAVTGGLQSYTVTKSIAIIASIKCGYWDTAKTSWIILILVRYRQFHLSKHLTFLLLTNHSLWKSINTLKNIIYNAFIFTMVSNLFHLSLQFCCLSRINLFYFVKHEQKNRKMNWSHHYDGVPYRWHFCRVWRARISTNNGHTQGNKVYPPPCRSLTLLIWGRGYAITYQR